KTISSGALSVQRNPFLQSRQIHRPISARTSGKRIPKFTKQNSKNGRPKSLLYFSCKTQPGYHIKTDLARKWSVISQTRNVAGTNAAATSARTCCCIRAWPKKSRHLLGFKINDRIPASLS